MANHWHCQNPGCYNRMQFNDVPECTRCGKAPTDLDAGHDAMCKDW